MRQPGAVSGRRRVRLALVVLLALGLGLAGLVLAMRPRTYLSPDGIYAVRYPRQWQPSHTGGLVTFREKDAGSEPGPSVTIVLSAMPPDWRVDFEDSLAKGLAALGGQYHSLGKDTLRIDGQEVGRYRYLLSLGPRKLRNTIYIFPLDKEKAAVMTCSGPDREDASLEAEFEAFARSFHLAQARLP
jgi:hypothetical protein